MIAEGDQGQLLTPHTQETDTATTAIPEQRTPESPIHARHVAQRPDTPLRMAYRGQRPESTPVWFLGQSVFRHPDNWLEWSLEERVNYYLRPEVLIPANIDPVRNFEVDAALCIPDVLFPLRMVGFDLLRGIGPDGGPFRPVRSTSQVDRILELPHPDWSTIESATRALRAELPADKVLIAIGGAPFVLSTLLVEGSTTGAQNLQTRIFMQSQPRNWERLIGWTAKLVRQYMEAQIRGGAEVVQMVDPWVRTLTEGEYACMAEPYAREIFNGFTDVVKISCNLGADHLLESIAPYVDVLGIGDNMSLEEAAKTAPGKILQGNIDPDYLLLDLDTARPEIERVLRSGLAAPAHIFNVAGALDPESDPDTVRRIVDFIHDFRH